MAGESSLLQLLRSMRPILHDGEYVFCTTDMAPGEISDLKAPGRFREAEGSTLILRREQADAAGLPYGPVFQMITLDVHSSLEAVGFLAAILATLAAHDIAVNVISAYYHDHLFVPAPRAREALLLLDNLSASA
jgi:uncharacterized protein